jgi:glycosyltransferase involved in cell wall biosynthesis
VDFSIVIPVYRYRESLENLLRDLARMLQANSYEIIVVIDNNFSEHSESLKKLKSQLTFIPIRLIQLNENIGQHKALGVGFTVARGDLLVCMDDDYKFTFQSMENALVKIQNMKKFDLIYGRVNKPKLANHFKIALFKIIRVFSLLPNPVPKKNGSSFKVYRNSVAKEVVSKNASFVFLDAFHLYAVKSIGYVDIEENGEFKEQSNYNFLRKLVFLYKVVSLYTFWIDLLLFGAMMLFVSAFILWGLFSEWVLFFVLFTIFIYYIYLLNSRKLIDTPFESYISKEL